MWVHRGQSHISFFSHCVNSLHIYFHSVCDIWIRSWSVYCVSWTLAFPNPRNTTLSYSQRMCWARNNTAQASPRQARQPSPGFAALSFSVHKVNDSYTTVPGCRAMLEVSQTCKEELTTFCEPHFLCCNKLCPREGWLGSGRSTETGAWPLWQVAYKRLMAFWLSCLSGQVHCKVKSRGMELY